MNTNQRIPGNLLIWILSATLLAACGGGNSSNVGGTSTIVFGRSLTFDDNVATSSVALDGSGDVYVGGYFRAFGRTRTSSIARMNSDGSLDTGFVTGTGFDDFVFSVVAATDGSGDVYVGGQFTTYQGVSRNGIARLNSDGSLDTNFDVGTGVEIGSMAPGTVWTIVPTNDGSGDIYIGGFFFSYNGTLSRKIARLNSDGSLDTGFVVGNGFEGSATTVFGLAVANDGSGNVYVSGTLATYNTVAVDGLVRLDSFGSIDNGFATGVDFSFASMAPIKINAIAVANDSSGDLYVQGRFDTFAGTGVSDLVRLNPVGTLDTGFTSSGLAGYDASVLIPALDGSGDIYVGGSIFSTFRHLARFNPDGSLDTGFASTTRVNNQVSTISIANDSSGDIYIAGFFTSYDGIGAGRLARLNSDASFDAGPTGVGFDSTVEDIAVAPDGSGRIYVSGLFLRIYDGIDLVKSVVRLGADGGLDTGFEAVPSLRPSVVEPVLDGSGDIYIGGNSGCNRLCRVNDDGSFDSGFINGSGFNQLVNDILLPTDGSEDVIAVGEFTDYNGNLVNRIARIDNAGSLVAGFAIGAQFDGTANRIIEANDGSGDYYVGGSFTNFNGAPRAGLVRLNSDGSLDTGFDIGSGFNDNVHAIARARDNSDDIFVAGAFTDYNGNPFNGIVRLNSDGSVDAGFTPGTGFSTTPFAAIVYTIYVDANTQVYAGGVFREFNGTSRNNLVRLNGNGVIDTSFSSGDGFLDNINSPVRVITPVNDGSGDILVGGDIKAYNHKSTNRIARISPSGQLR